MRDFDETNITDAVLARFAETPDARLRQLITALVVHLHDAVREVAPTFDEWLAAIHFLTRTGQMCDDNRQEFILLSDTLGISMLVDALNHGKADGVTETTILGPFHVADAPLVANGADIAGGLSGTPLYIEGRVTGGDGEKLAGATVDIWHADGEGFYDVQRPELAAYALRCRLQTDADGGFRVRTIMPSAYPIPHDGPVGEMLRATKRHPWRPAHVHFMITLPGYQSMVTHVFAAGGDYLDSDAVFGVKNSLIHDFATHDGGTMPDGTKITGLWRSLRFDFGLQKLDKL